MFPFERTMQLPKKKKPRLEKTLEIAANVGELAMSLRDRPTRLDWVSLGLRAFALGLKIRSEQHRQRSQCPWSYFEGDEAEDEWIEIPGSLRELVLKHVRDVEIVEDYWDQDVTSDLVCLGTLEGNPIGWLSNFDGKIQDGPYMRSDRQPETHAALGTCLWRELGCQNLIYSADGLTPDPFLCGIGMMSEQFSGVQSRVAAFLATETSRSLLFTGPPGTGKSTGIRQVAASLGLRTLRVDIRLLTESPRRRDQSVTNSLDTLVRALAPDTLILDDIDRVREEDKLLHFLELAKRTCRLVLASANNPKEMSKATLRPGRFDELVEVTRPDPRIVRELLGDCPEAIDQLGALPMAYINEFVQRRNALGIETALAELPGLVERFKESEQL